MISAVILTKNEEKNIEVCLKSLDFCDEIIVIDDNSVDKTVELAKKSKAKVFTRALNNDFSRQRNFGLEKAHEEWVLFIDADERVSPSLCDEITQLTNNPITQCNGFYIKRRDFMWENELKCGETGDIKLLRLARKEGGKWEGRVHEKWKVKGKLGELKNLLLHYPHQTITEFLREINFYTDIRAQELYEKGTSVYWWSIILYPKVKFFRNFFVKKGFLDGLPGLILALMMSFHSFLVRGKLWLMQQKKN
ncbi:glycosyltransferase family 2 protein [Candidatus Microgenomates bacterium]|nr:glycosyltransferase family 2 protein [Candidatus Microgenomates bacterium]